MTHSFKSVFGFESDDDFISSMQVFVTRRLDELSGDLSDSLQVFDVVKSRMSQEQNPEKALEELRKAKSQRDEATKALEEARQLAEAAGYATGE